MSRALLWWMEQRPYSEGSTPRYGLHREEVPVSGAPTTGILDPTPDTGKTQFIYFLIVFYKNISKCENKEVNK